MILPFQRAAPPARPAPGPAVWLPFAGSDLIMAGSEARPIFLQGDTESPPMACEDVPLFLGTWNGLPCLACTLSAEALLPPNSHPLGMRALLALLPEDAGALAGFASQILHWRRTSRFCPVCGGHTEWKGGDWGRRCLQCGHVAYPHISPAVLALIHDGPRLLLVHKPEWSTMHSLVAGFVEPQEGLEECVVREVREEVGIDVTDIVYQGSQAWPFPHQVMLGFTARYAGGEIALDLSELDRAAWFTVDTLPSLPSAISLSRRLIDAWRTSTLNLEIR